jgi:ribosomal protein S18 acetylase RimI-like enzyme
LTGSVIPSRRVAKGPLDERDIHQVDEAQVLAFIAGILDGECGLNVHRRLARSVHRYFVEFQPGQECFVALVRDEIIYGLMAVDRLTDSKAILKWFFIGPEDRDAGLGNRLLSQALDFTESKGYRRLILGTMSQMEAAHHLYRKHGFVYKQQVTFWGRPMMVYEREFGDNAPGGLTPAAPLMRARSSDV